MKLQITVCIVRNYDREKYQTSIRSVWLISDPYSMKLETKIIYCCINVIWWIFYVQLMNA